MYQEHFGLKRPPFKITPDTSLFFEGSQRGAALDALTYAIRSGEGIIKVVGEVGSGKTMLCRMLEVRLNDEIDVVYIANPSLSPDNILHVIAHELHLDVSKDMSKVDVMQKIQSHLLDKHASNRQVVLFVEEAQSMPIETLEEIRLLSNLETDENKLLQMVLFGQPELDEKLSVQHIRQLKERITHSFNLSPFAPEDTLQYLNFRLRAVGYKGPDIFTKKTANVVKKYSGGLTRRINIIADKALLAAFSESSHTVTPSHVRSAAQDSEFKNSSDNKKYLWTAVGVFLLIIAVSAGFYLGQHNLQNSTDAQNPGENVPVKRASESADNVASASEAEAVAEANSELTAEPGANAAGSIINDNVAVKLTEDSDSNRVMPVSAEIVSKSISSRIQNTDLWLSAAADRDYSIQLFMVRTSNADELDAFLQDMPEMLDFTKIYIYETVISGRSWYGVVYDEYSSYDEAMTVLKQLPVSLQASDPYLRRVSALKKDAARKL